MKTTGLLLLAILAISVGCTKTDKVGEDLLKYVNESILPLLPLERARNEAVARFDKIVAAPPIDHDALAKDLNDLETSSHAAVDEALKIHPASKEVQELHEAYIANAKEISEGADILIAAQAKNDPEMVKAGTAKISEGNRANIAWVEQTHKLGDAHGVTFKKR